MRTFAKVEDDAGMMLNKNAKVTGANKGGREKERKERDVLTDVGFRVANADTRPARGGSARGRGGRSRPPRSEQPGGGGRGGRGTSSIRIDDASAFPSLG